MNVAFLGCGYVAAQYAATLRHHPELRTIGAFDIDRSRSAVFAAAAGARSYENVDALLADREVDLVINLTDPRSHYLTTRACLESGKHVYSEKPLAMSTAEARELVECAKRHGKQLSSAPCSVLSPAAQTLWQAIRSEAAGRVRLVYAEFDDGMIAPHMAPWTWRNEHGVAWPAKAEFEVGSTYQHAGYVLTWLCAMFGPVERVTAFASVLIPDKGVPVDVMAPDFTVGCLEFHDGIVARVTCGLTAPRSKSITVIGDKGILSVGNVRNDDAPVLWRSNTESRLGSIIRRRARPLHSWLQARLGDAGLTALLARRYPQWRGAGPSAIVSADKPVDFLRGPSEMAAAIDAGRTPRLSAEFGLHIVELIERLQYPGRFSDARVTTSFAPIAPMFPSA